MGSFGDTFGAPGLDTAVDGFQDDDAWGCRLFHACWSDLGGESCVCLTFASQEGKTWRGWEETSRRHIGMMGMWTTIPSEVGDEGRGNPFWAYN